MSCFYIYLRDRREVMNHLNTLRLIVFQLIENRISQICVFFQFDSLIFGDKNSPNALTTSVCLIYYLRVKINKRAFWEPPPKLKGCDPQEAEDFLEGKAASYFLLSNENNKIYRISCVSYLCTINFINVHTKSTHLEHQYTLQPKSLRLGNNIDWF